MQQFFLVQNQWPLKWEKKGGGGNFAILRVPKDLNFVKIVNDSLHVQGTRIRRRPKKNIVVIGCMVWFFGFPKCNMWMTLQVFIQNLSKSSFDSYRFYGFFGSLVHQRKTGFSIYIFKIAIWRWTTHIITIWPWCILVGSKIMLSTNKVTHFGSFLWTWTLVYWYLYICARRWLFLFLGACTNFLSM